LNELQDVFGGQGNWDGLKEVTVPANFISQADSGTFNCPMFTYMTAWNRITWTDDLSAAQIRCAAPNTAVLTGYEGACYTQPVNFVTDHMWNGCTKPGNYI